MENKEIKELANNILKKTKGDILKIETCLKIAQEDKKLLNALFFEIFKKTPDIFFKLTRFMIDMLDESNIKEVISHAVLVEDIDEIRTLFYYAQLTEKNYKFLAELASDSTLNFKLLILNVYPEKGSKEAFKSIFNLVLTSCKENPNVVNQEPNQLYSISKKCQCDNEMYNKIFELFCDYNAYSKMAAMFSEKLTTSNIEKAVDIFCNTNKHLCTLSTVATSPLIQGKNLHRILTTFVKNLNINTKSTYFKDIAYNLQYLLQDTKVLQDEKALNLVWRAVIAKQNKDLYEFIVENVTIPKEFVDAFVAKCCEIRSGDELRSALLKRHEVTGENIDKLVKAICENAYEKELVDTIFSKKINAEHKKACLDTYLEVAPRDQFQFVVQFLEGDEFLFMIKRMIDQGFIFEASRFLEFGKPSKEYIDLIAKPVAENGVDYHSYCLLTEDISFEIFKKCLENVKNSEHKSHVIDWLVDAAKNLKNQERRELVVSAIEEIEEQRKKEEEKKNKILAPSEMIEKYLEELE